MIRRSSLKIITMKNQPEIQVKILLHCRSESQIRSDLTPSQLASIYGHERAESFINESLPRKALRPTRWTLHNKVPSTTILQDDESHVSHQGKTKVCISPDHPVPADSSLYYYEVEILDADTAESLSKMQYSGPLFSQTLLNIYSQIPRRTVTPHSQ